MRVCLLWTSWTFSNEPQIDFVYRTAYSTMGFKDDKTRILEDLETLNFDHEARGGRIE